MALLTLAELFDTLVSRDLLPSAKDKKTALVRLAASLGYSSMAACPVSAICQDAATWRAKLDAYWPTLEAQKRAAGARRWEVSAETRGNTLSYLRQTFQIAREQGLLTVPLPPRLLLPQGPTHHAMRRLQRDSSPYKSTYRSTVGAQSYGLPETAWPPDYVAGWQAYLDACPSSLRPVTLASTHRGLTLYFGYLQRWGGGLPSWDEVLSVPPLKAFVRWHGDRMKPGETVSHFGCFVAAKVAAIAKVAAKGKEDKDPAACKARALADFRNDLESPDRLHKKKAYHDVTLRDLEDVANACLAEGSKRPLRDKRTRKNGLYYASRFQVGVILKILVRIPLRQRNIRELLRDTQLFQDSRGEWQLELKGTALKIRRRGRAENRFEKNLSTPDQGLDAVLKKWLDRDAGVRRIFPGAATAPTVFLTCAGRPFTRDALYVQLRDAVARYTGKRFYPHLIRSMWTDAYLAKHPGDFAGAAEALGDTILTVMRTYFTPDKKALEAKGAAFVQETLKG